MRPQSNTEWGTRAELLRGIVKLVLKVRGPGASGCKAGDVLFPLVKGEMDKVDTEVNYSSIAALVRLIATGRPGDAKASAGGQVAVGVRCQCGTIKKIDGAARQRSCARAATAG